MIFPPHRRKLIYSLVLGFGIGLVCLVDYCGFLVGLNQYCYDLFFRLRGRQAPSQHIVIIGIDEKTLDTLGQWPIDRKYYAQALDRLRLAGGVGIDLIFAEPSPDDPQLARSIEDHGHVVLPVYVDAYHGISNPLPDFSSASNGHVHLEPDVDGVVRKIHHSIYHQEKFLPSFSSVLSDMVPGFQFERSRPEKLAQRQPVTNTILQTDPMRINYAGPRGTFETISMADLLANEHPPEFFKNKIALIGVTAEGIRNGFLIPFSENRDHNPGVEIHANSLNTILTGYPIRPLPPVLNTLFIVFAGIMGFALFTFVGGSRAAILGFLGLILVPIGAYILFGTNRWFAPAAVEIMLMVAFILAYLYSLEKLNQQLQNAKIQWETTFNTIDDAVLIHDTTGKIIRSNQASIILLDKGITKILKDRCRKLVHRYSHPGKSDDAENSPVRLTFGGTEELEVDMGKDTPRQVIEVKSLPQFDNHNQLSRVVQVVRNITSRRIAEEERRLLEAQLIEAQKMEAIGTLAGGIAHDFNNILSGVMGYADLSLMQIEPDSELGGNLREINKAGEQGKNLVQQILTLGRRVRPERRPFRYYQVVEDALKLLKTLLPNTISIETTIETRAMVKGDPTQCHQIIMNLGTNAVHAMLPDGGRLTVKLSLVKLDGNLSDAPVDLSPGEYLRLSVRDTGTGMEAETAARIFEPYFTTKSVGKGTGLGLAVVHSIVKDHDGAIALESNPGQGSTFSIYLPRVTEADKGEETATDKTVCKGSGHILLVDDASNIVQVLTDMLTLLGYTVTANTSSPKALDLFRAEPDRFDAVITDMTMPEMTGDRLAQEVLKIRPEIPIILCTGYSQDINQKAAVDLGIRRFLMKPVKIEVLTEVLQEILPSPANPSEDQGQ